MGIADFFSGLFGKKKTDAGASDVQPEPVQETPDSSPPVMEQDAPDMGSEEVGQ